MDEIKFVDFNKYCKTCVNHTKSEEEDPCWDCLTEPTNVNSEKPVRWEEKEK